jgi:hypothetical protein
MTPALIFVLVILLFGFDSAAVTKNCRKKSENFLKCPPSKA